MEVLPFFFFFLYFTPLNVLSLDVAVRFQVEQDKI